MRFGHGLLTYFLIEALRGPTELQEGGRLSLYRLLDYVTARVQAAAEQMGRTQNPTMRGQIDGALTYTVFAINNKQRVRALAVAMAQRHPLLPDVPTFKELGVDWVDGAMRGIGVPKSTPPDVKKRLSDLFAQLNADPEMKELAAKSGFELINVGVEQMDAFMKERAAVYGETAKMMGLGVKKP